MVSLSLAAAEESDAGTPTLTKMYSMINGGHPVARASAVPASLLLLTQVSDLQRDLDGNLQGSHRAGGRAAALLHSRQSDLQR